MFTVYLVAAGVGCTFIVVQFILQLIGVGGGDMDSPDAGGVDLHGAADFHTDFQADLHTDVGHIGGDIGGDIGGHDAAAHAVESVTGTNLFLSLLSFRTISAFLAFFGLVGLACREADFRPSATLALSTLAGLVSMVLVALAFRFLIGLQASGTLSIHNAVGKTASVYIPIPGSRAGRGKVTLTIQGRLQEYAAVTSGSPLARGASVRIKSVVDADTLEVEALGEKE
ncbi:MAG: hypothetical protein JXP34_00065 [Planctomycetes bacterium]|nr:hypothetical protein [Planctomycetota bacterium]